MITVSEIVEEELQKHPFIVEGIADDLINISSLARRIKPIIEKRLRKDVTEGAVVMAVKRLKPALQERSTPQGFEFNEIIGDVIVRSDLNTYCFKNSQSLAQKQTLFLDQIKDQNDVFCTFSQGVFERTLIVSKTLAPIVTDTFKGEELIHQQEQLASITLQLSNTNVQISGIYYHLLKRIAWEGIPISEVISTTNEFTIVVPYQFVDRAFSILMGLKNNG